MRPRRELVHQQTIVARQEKLDTQHADDLEFFEQRAGDLVGIATDLLAHLGGPQIQDKAIPGAEFEQVPDGVPVSVRLPPPVFGVGLIEAILIAGTGTVDLEEETLKLLATVDKPTTLQVFSTPT